MNEELTQTLHAAAGQLHGALPAGAEIRRRAERRRRRRVASGVAVGACVLVVAVAVLSATSLGRKAGLGPVRPPTPTPITVDRALLSARDWTDLTGGGSERVQPVDAAPHQVHRCVPDPRLLGSAPPISTLAATYRQPARPGVRINEFVLRYRSTSAASSVVDAMWSRFQRCTDPAYVKPSGQQGYRRPDTGLDDTFYAEQALASAEGPTYGPEPFLYGVDVARSGAVVVVVESTGWADRPGHTLLVAMGKAVRKR